MAPGFFWNKVAFAGEIIALALALREFELIIENEILIVDQVQNQAEIIGGGEQGTFLAAAVEMLVFGVEW